jgi:predicted nucleotidyltransferase
MALEWRSEIRQWAAETAAAFASRAGVLGVVLGGSLARGQEWRHSDLELGILVEERDPNLPYFNIVGERGVEAIQLVRRELAEQVRLVEQGDLAPVQSWPIQLWAGRIVSDPSGLLARFQQQFRAHLFAPEVVQGKVVGAQKKVNDHLVEARGLLSGGKPRLALAHARLAMNEAILAVHWAHGTLPRSQNRTDSRLRQLCRKYDLMPFYGLYREVFALEEAAKAIKVSWPQVKPSVLEITRLWGGDSARDFFIFAVDSDFRWRQNAGILTVYRLYIPIIGGPEHGISARLDDPEWAGQNQAMLHFLGLAQSSPEVVADLIAKISGGTQVYT